MQQTHLEGQSRNSDGWNRRERNVFEMKLCIIIRHQCLYKTKSSDNSLLSLTFPHFPHNNIIKNS